jgi:predicted phage gp36 major capsid-like protein
VNKLAVSFRKQPDLEWYFETAATSPGNREQVRGLVAGASPEIHGYFRIATEEGKTVWWWPMVVLLAQRNRGYIQG